MENKKWLNLTEYLLLAGSGIGSVASIASQQLAVTAAPFSFLLLLSLANRQRATQAAQKKSEDGVVQLNQKLSGQIKILGQQVKTLPTLSDFSSFTRSASQRTDAAIAHLQSDIAQRLAPFEASAFSRMTQEMADLQHKYTKLSDTLTAMTATLNRVASAHQEGVGTVPPEVRKLIAQLNSDIAQLQTKLAEVSSSQQQGNSRALQDEINNLHRRLNRLPQPFDATMLKQDVGELTKIVGDLVSRRDLARLMVEVERIRGQQQQLEQTVLPMKTVNTIMRKQMDTLSSWVQSKDATSSERIATPASDCELVLGLKSSHNAGQDTLLNRRALLEEALKTAQSRVIVVFPYPDRTTLDADLITQFRGLLDRGASLDVGWGHLGNVQDRQARCIHKPSDFVLSNPLEPHFTSGDPHQTAKKFLATTLNQLTQLKREYPNQFRFKVLGTDENFLVCDRAYAILGIHPVATTSAAFPEVAVGVRTRSAEVIEGLIERYDHPVLAANDETAYYNRAITRYELGDKQGAIADYSEVVRINPNHDIAYNNRALVREELKNREGAIVDLNRSILSNPRNCVAYCNRGIIRLRSGDMMSAIEDFSYAIQVDLDCTNAFAQRGLARLRLGNVSGAIDDFTAMIRINSQNPVGYFHRGLALSKAGDKTKAIRDLKEAAWLFSAQGNQANHQHAIAAINKLRSHCAAQSSQERASQEKVFPERVLQEI